MMEDDPQIPDSPDDWSSLSDSSSVLVASTASASLNVAIPEHQPNPENLQNDIPENLDPILMDASPLAPADENRDPTPEFLRDPTPEFMREPTPEYMSDTSSNDSSQLVDDALSRRYEDLARLSGSIMQGLRRAIFRMDRNRRRIRLISNMRNAEEQILRVAGESGFSDDSAGDVAGGGEDEAQADSVSLPENAICFDTNLPAEHTYLSANMSRVAGVNYLDLDQTHKIMLFSHPYILLPGEVLPLMINGPFIEGSLDDTQNGTLFGVCFPIIGNEREDLHYGVTCQIYERGEDERGYTVVKTRALQRFVTKRDEFSSPLPSIAISTPNYCYGFVRILPEIYLPEPLKCLDMGSMKRFRDIDSMRGAYRKFQAATTPWPPHVYDMYGIEEIVIKAREQLAQHKILTMPTDIIQLSYWLVRNLHMSDSMMQKCFLTDSVNIRMKMIASTFKETAIFSCRLCRSHIANCPELFAMSKHGVQTQYCNSAGYVHETNTVYQCVRDAITLSGAPSTEYSWFPGYSWQIIICAICSRHLGWEFKALEANLVPRMFYGLAGASVLICHPSSASTNPRELIARIIRRARPRIR